MPKYEIAILFNASLEQAKINQVVLELEKFWQANQGKLLEKELWPARDLAYPVKKATKGIYFFAQYELPEEKNPSLIKELNLNHEILKYLITIPPEGLGLKIIVPRVVKEGEKKPIAEKPKKIIEKKVAAKPVVAKPIIEKPEVKPEVKVEKKVEKKEVVTEEEKPVEVKPEPKSKTVAESKKAKAKEQKEKKVPEADLDKEIDRILSDEDLL